LKIQLCHGQNCQPRGGKALADACRQRGIPFEATPCHSLCPYAPIVMIDGRLRMHITLSELQVLSEAA